MLFSNVGRVNSAPPNPSAGLEGHNAAGKTIGRKEKREVKRKARKGRGGRKTPP